jgi:predicted PurR-regulated permease PerM
MAALVVAVGILLLNYVADLRDDYRQAKARQRVAASVETQAKAAAARSALPTEANAAESAGCDSSKQEKSDGQVDNQRKATFFSTISNNIVGFLDNVKHRFESLPLTRRILNKLSEYLADGKAEEQITSWLLKRSGGVWAFIGKFIAGFASFLLNLLLTFFFFSLLLNKLAMFINSRKDKRLRASSYLIQTVFNGKWLPQMSEENLREGDRIVGEVINKLRIWLRGYMTMIAIDFCVYTTAFIFLGIPYAPILGAIAAVGILLPYIGPISSALLTVLVTLAVGGADATVLQIVGALAVYLIHNGIIEQFFIYPWIIGESLGLSTLETIIVVLLGGILAGIPGMIFAMPVASVIKYLVPQIYRCWR